MKDENQIVELTEKYSAHNYKPLPVVLSEGEGVWVKDVNGNYYLDMLASYSALNQGHRHPKIINALFEQAKKLTITSRAFHNDILGEFCQKVAETTSKDKALPMNTGAEAVETALKAARRWGYRKKKVDTDKAEIIACESNFHGRTMFPVSLSTSESATQDYGPMIPEIKKIPFGDLEALKGAIGPNTVGFLFEPIQGEGGVVIPPEGYLKKAFDICKENNVLFIADEIQTGLGRTGKLFACDWEGVQPDIYILGKALGGGVYPVSCIAADDEVMDVFEPGSHGSTFGGNPLACVVGKASLDVIMDEDLPARSKELGEYFYNKLAEINSPVIKEVRGKGLFIGMELTEPARPYCLSLKEQGILCKETRDYVIRFAPPLVIEKETLDEAIQTIKEIFEKQ
ncbi:ornithine--oxo-acid transaminase [Natranaerobius thermophilus]|uniref:Ornithine aminotransferase n=1 Tax=Natranaerobius thermophilus (strain ATCC BAA-1301 / DSM 18059 / JW/NM-WN-LF) TaxID=457570 RepID=B2A1J3_NATTJ|nr:ornithine--oxo-acid transaminase [Natranaerobius thermophilus]ACB84733.1 aminotransferase [Natranaerobius thermophilus JW/NM-WN-LF]